MQLVGPGSAACVEETALLQSTTNGDSYLHPELPTATPTITNTPIPREHPSDASLLIRPLAWCNPIGRSAYE